MRDAGQRQRPVGELLRGWRERRRLSQLDLSILAEISARRLSSVETGRSVPSRDVIVHLTEELDIPLRERNHLLLAAGLPARVSARAGLSGSRAGDTQQGQDPGVMTALLDGRRTRHHRQVPRARGRTPPAGRDRAFRFGGARTQLQ